MPDHPAAGPPADVVVVGSLNLDVVVRVAHHPKPGETVLADDRFDTPGGKGANQAVAAARLGRRVAMVGLVGDDAAGAQLRQALEDAGVDHRGVGVDPGAPTGTAFITVSDDGENAIVVVPGANSCLTAEHVRAWTDVVTGAAVCLLQLEVGDDAVTAAAEAADGLVILNPAPARRLPPELLARVDLLVPNQSELAVMAGVEEVPTGSRGAAQLACILPVDRVVVTLGADGALVVDHGTVTHMPAPAVQAVDTTAAGDAFCGALADALAGGRNLVDATRWAVRAGACAVRRPGAQVSLPSRLEVEDMTDAI